MTASTLERAAADYLCAEPGFARLLPLLIKKYHSLGRMGGSVVVPSLEAAEVDAYTAFFRRTFTVGKEARISLAQFAAALAKTKFDGANPVEVLACCWGEELVSSQEADRQKRAEQQTFWQSFGPHCRSELSRRWLTAVMEKTLPSRSLSSAYERDKDELKQAVHLLITAVDALPAAYERLPVFARRLCGDPHALDGNTLAGRLLLEALKLLAANPPDEAGKSRVEAENELLYSFGLLRDDVQNFITCAGLIADHAPGYWREAWQAKAVLNVPLREIVRADRFSCAAEEQRTVFIVENAGVFSALLDWFMEQELPLPPLVCTHGQFRLAAWAALERLAKGGCTMYYAGDFDPEGLVMAERLITRYPGCVRLWRYTVADYAAALSSVQLTASRLNKLAAITSPQLKLLADKMIVLQKAGYQEALLEAMAQDMVKAGRQQAAD